MSKQRLHVEFPLILPSWRLVLLAGGLAIAFSSCSRAASVSTQAYSEPTAILVADHYRLHLASPKLLGEIALLNPRTRKVGKFLQAEASIQNVSTSRYTIEYRFEWFDRDQFSIESVSTWHRATITAGEIINVRSLGKSAAAEKFHLTVRLVDDVFIESSR